MQICTRLHGLSTAGYEYKRCVLPKNIFSSKCETGNGPVLERVLSRF